MAEQNHMQVMFDAKSVNESLARMVVTAFMTDMNPTLEQISDVKTAVSEAVTNAIIHGYNSEDGIITLEGSIDKSEVTFTITDYGVGISDIQRAREPLYSGKPEMERSGMGFTIMETFMDDIKIESAVGKGTKITMTKTIEVPDEG